jgi:hypothetical protein
VNEHFWDPVTFWVRGSNIWGMVCLILMICSRSNDFEFMIPFWSQSASLHYKLVWWYCQERRPILSLWDADFLGKNDHLFSGCQKSVRSLTPERQQFRPQSVNDHDPSVKSTRKSLIADRIGLSINQDIFKK